VSDSASRYGRHDTARVLKSSAIVGLGTALSRVTGLLRVAAISYALGATTLAGVYSWANETPNIVYELLLGGVLTATLVPQFVRHLDEDDEDATSAVFTVSMLVLLAITVIGVIAAPVIVRVYLLQVEGDVRANQQELGTAFMRVFMPQILFYGMTALGTAMLQARRRFAAAALVPILNNLVVIGIFFALPRVVGGPFTVRRVLDDDGLLLFIGLGTTSGIAAMGLALLPALRRARVKIRFLPAWRHPAVRRVMRLSGWTIGYVAANQVALAYVIVLANGVDLATGNGHGGAFVYFNAYLLFVLPYGLLGFPIMTAVAPELAAAGRRGDPPALRHRFARTLRLSLTVLIPAAAVAVALARPIVTAVMQRGAFTPGDANLVADTMVGFAVGLPFFSTYLFALRAFYALDDTKRPFLFGCFQNALNIVLAVLLFEVLDVGIPGLAFAHSGAYAVGAGLTLFALSRRIGSLRGRGIELLGARVVVVSAVAGTAAWLIGKAGGWETSGQAMVSTLLALGASGAITVGGLLALRVEEFSEVLDLVLGRFRRALRRSPGDGRRNGGGPPPPPPLEQA
jgi:putative peptidoglycan lipid II flippase